jgi:hypothetical protein
MFMIVLLPAPVGPTSPIFCPGLAVKVLWRSTLRPGT